MYLNNSFRLFTGQCCLVLQSIHPSILHPSSSCLHKLYITCIVNQSIPSYSIPKPSKVDQTSHTLCTDTDTYQ